MKYMQTIIISPQNVKHSEKFIKYVDNNIYKQFFNLMFFTGTRPGEAMALKFSDLHNNYISIKLC